MRFLFPVLMLISLPSGLNAKTPTDRDPTNPGLKEVLFVGDSVMAGIERSDQGMKLLSRQFTFAFAANGCQRLTLPGCTKSSKTSSLELLKQSDGLITRVVVVATGYNEFNNSTAFRRDVLRICNEAKRQGIQVLWLTYQEAGNVKKKSRAFNTVLHEVSITQENLEIIDWNLYSEGHSDWFAEDDVHLSGIGPLKMAKLIAEGITTKIHL